MSDDVKDLLARAIGQEPPLRIDRDEVLREGRKSLRRRRLFASGGVVAAVVVAAAGAAILPDLVGDSGHERMPPAATSTMTSPLPPDSTRAEPTLSESRAAELTVKLHREGYLPVAAVEMGDDGPPRFRVRDDKYVYEANVVTRSGAGQLQFTVEDSRGVQPDCADVIARSTYNTCEIRREGGGEVLVARRWTDKEVAVTHVLTVLPDGTLVTATLAKTMSDGGSSNAPPGAFPVLDDETLSSIVVKSGFSVR